MSASEKKAMQRRPPKFTLLPNTGLPTTLSDCSKAHQVALKVPDAIDLSVTLTLPAAGVGGIKSPMAERLEPDGL